MDLWRYCTAEKWQEFLVSLDLLGGVPADRAAYLRCLYALSNHPEAHYRTLSVPKRGGGRRTLREPDALLKKVQKNILRHILDGAPVSEYACAYRKGMGVRQNAAIHLGQPMILKLDIHDFFGSITFPMVMRSAFPGTLFPPAAATMLTSLCCFRDVLPQGAPTSAAISNLVMEPFDRHMGAWCAARGIRYSRYCDDMTFSGAFDAGEVEAKVRAFLEAMGFSLNRKKTKLMTAGRRQTVTGLVVNEKLQVPREYQRALRQELYFCETYGVRSHMERKNGRVPSEEEAARYLESLAGKVAYVASVDPESENARRMQEKIKNLIKK